MVMGQPLSTNHVVCSMISSHLIKALHGTEDSIEVVFGALRKQHDSAPTSRSHRGEELWMLPPPDEVEEGEARSRGFDQT